ncbi:T9SS type A sorting domain-containing protein [Chitinophaga oryziterrae]|uniref:T9SS type A sorting domain-containing protein n=1 Tax=Chitinophaga oryziterrae TaxID=1031224 RepID=A0A6N8JJP6_9BACT|nr:T9SS type A sorting domain-containing protein [Chitinophaga oryziterrae]MVT44392.1 T9SS type A sorting domain-containing protein [Chitinophaga oryziterrae]
MELFFRSKKFITVCLLLLAAAKVMAQSKPSFDRDVKSSTGFSQVLPGIQLDFTIGEAVVVPLVYTDLALTQGFQQPPAGPVVKPPGADDLVLYPNPAEDQASIKFSLDTGTTKVDIRVLNRIGQLIFTDTVLPEGNYALLYTLNTSAWIPGIYVVNIKMDTGLSVAKLLVKM